jgi:hypothetical protein
MVWADIGELEYLRVKMHNTRHDIVIVDYDEEAGVAWVADNDREELQPCSLESLARARNSPAFPGPNRHTTFVYEWPAQLREPRDAVRRALVRAVANMRETPQALAGLAGSNGLEGVDRFAQAYADWPQTFGDDIQVALKGMAVLIVKAGTGGAMFRSLHAEFLSDMGALLDDEQLTGLGAHYDRLAAAWRSLADAGRENDHAAGIEIVAEIATLERRGIEQTEQLLAEAT